MRIHTIGFTKCTAENFFDRIRTADISTLIDTRINATSQLSGFAKRTDLEFFLRVICNARYRHETELAPPADLLKEYRAGMLSWCEYEELYLELLRNRKVEEVLRPEDFENSVLLCSEHVASKCHRRLAAEYLANHWGPIEIVHL